MGKNIMGSWSIPLKLNQLISIMYSSTSSWTTVNIGPNNLEQKFLIVSFFFKEERPNVEQLFSHWIITKLVLFGIWQEMQHISGERAAESLTSMRLY